MIVGAGVGMVVGMLVAWVVVAGLLVWALIRLLGLEGRGHLVQLIALTPYAALASLLVAVALAALRWSWPAAGAAVALLALAVVVLAPRRRRRSTPRRPATSSDGVSLTIMSMNMLYGGADPAQIVALVRDHDVAVLAVQEFTGPAGVALAAAGLDRLLPFALRVPPGHGEDPAAGSALYSRLPLADPTDRVLAGRFHQESATITPPGGRPVVVESVHPTAPVRRAPFDNWADGLAAQVPADAPGPPRVLIGDFNATLDHAALRSLLATGYVDAAAAVGRGFVPTWPYLTPASAPRSWVPKVTIDHALLGPGLGVRSVRASTVERTDHRALIVTVIVPRA